MSLASLFYFGIKISDASCVSPYSNSMSLILWKQKCFPICNGYPSKQGKKLYLIFFLIAGYKLLKLIQFSSLEPQLLRFCTVLSVPAPERSCPGNLWTHSHRSPEMHYFIKDCLILRCLFLNFLQSILLTSFFFFSCK